MVNIFVNKADSKGRISLGKSAAGKFYIIRKGEKGAWLREFDPENPSAQSFNFEEIPNSDPAPPVRPIEGGTVRDLD